MKTKVSKTFLWGLAMVTILTFAVNTLKYFSIVDFSPHVGGITNLAIGVLLMVEGNVLQIAKFFKDKKITGEELLHITTVMLGLVVAVGGVMELIGYSVAGTPLGGLVAFANAIVIVFVIIQTFVV